MFRRREIICCLLIHILLGSCSEIYDPAILSDRRVLVVDGLITDQAESYAVSLSYAIPYDAIAYAKDPVSLAEIVIRDDEGNGFYLTESLFNPGEYYSDPAEFISSAGRYYTLHISTPDGEVYESSPQLLLKGMMFDSIYGEHTITEFPSLSPSGKFYFKNYKGWNIYLSFNNLSSELSRFRYLYSYYIQFVAEPLAFDNPPTYYIWSNRGKVAKVNITGSEYSLSSNSIMHKLCFFPFDKSYYSFTREWPDSVYDNYIDKYVISIDQYGLNEQAYEYYKAIDRQLKAEGQIFDPIAAQLSGNVKCISNPEKPAIGFFEASSYESCTYVVYPGRPDKPVTFEKISGLGEIPFGGYTINTPPPFWIR